MKFLLAFMPKEYKEMIILGQRIVNRLDTSAERQEAISYGVEMLQDGKVTVGAWAKYGSKLGILKSPNSK